MTSTNSPAATAKAALATLLKGPELLLVAVALFTLNVGMGPAPDSDHTEPFKARVTIKMHDVMETTAPTIYLGS